MQDLYVIKLIIKSSWKVISKEIAIINERMADITNQENYSNNTDSEKEDEILAYNQNAADTSLCVWDTHFQEQIRCQ
jgi:hypothetical protein